MKEGKGVIKVPGGKLIRVDVAYSDRLDEIKITGDFFLHPEDVLAEIEANLKGMEFPIRRTDLIEQIRSILQAHDATLVGVQPEDIITALEIALQ